MKKTAKIVEEDGKYKLYNSKKTKVLGTHDSYEDALKQERAIWASKRASLEKKALLDDRYLIAERGSPNFDMLKEHSDFSVASPENKEYIKKKFKERQSLNRKAIKDRVSDQAWSSAGRSAFSSGLGTALLTGAFAGKGNRVAQGLVAAPIGATVGGILGGGLAKRRGSKTLKKYDAATSQVLDEIDTDQRVVFKKNAESKHDLIFYANRSTPEVVPKGAEGKKKKGYGKQTKRRAATADEEKTISTGK